MVARLESSDVVVTNQSDKVIQMARILDLNMALPTVFSDAFSSEDAAPEDEAPEDLNIALPIVLPEDIASEDVVTAATTVGTAVETALIGKSLVEL